MGSMRELTELEGCVLGLIKSHGPCTPYVVRREFLRSPTPHWSGSAGAIYPLFRRLRGMRLIRRAGASEDRRGGILYALTAAGEAAFARWLGPPFDALTLGVPPDPIRTRISFLGLLSPAQRSVFFSEATANLRSSLTGIKDALAREEDPFERLAVHGAQVAMQSRLAWLIEMDRTLRRDAALGQLGA